MKSMASERSFRKINVDMMDFKWSYNMLQTNTQHKINLLCSSFDVQFIGDNP